MDRQLVRSVTVLGGGTAGWMTAAALAKALNGKVEITVVESDEIGTIGVGEATIPGIVRFNALLGLDENEFLRETQGTFKLGIEFADWTFLGDRYMHGFGRFRQDIQLTSFEQIWQKMNLIGRARELGDYSITKRAAYAGKFMRPRLDVPDSPLADIAYAFHFDAGLYARYLRRYAEARGVRRIEGRVDTVERRSGERRPRGARAGRRPESRGRVLRRLLGMRGRSSRTSAASATTTGRTGCRAIAPSRCRRPRPRRCCPTRARPRSKLAGSGASRCSTASATATCTAAAT